MSSYWSWQIRAGRAAARLSYADVLRETGIAVSMQQRIDEAEEIVTRGPGEPKKAGTFDGEAVARIVELIERHGFRISKSGKRIEVAL